VYFIQREHVKRLKGRVVLKDFDEEHKIKYSNFLNWKLTSDLENNSDPLFKYVKRYIKESGF
jgi:hypothetical protein